ncbi:MAG: bifunctional phosphopantothenoylcysteine decarboxylase/phosphopantothenate--cysteine ligase CoaBC [Euryarchaeota archaeon]|nr:bifunctional phosphopantothenoylcysteine decarboxylase/phosphopantothenate--cysteine ligase CoaBC [Euryarchaeota archaeon]
MEGSKILEGRRLALCVTGSVAAIESPKIARELVRLGAEVTAYMTPDSSGIITPDVMEFATGRPPVTRLTGKLEHLENFDLVLVAPATANTIAKIACGLADNAVTALVFSTKAKVLVAPGMQADMYSNPILKENMEKLRRCGMVLIEPRMEEGKAKLASLEAIVDAVISALYKKDLTGKRVLVTAGPTQEPLDPVRVITNRSSGKMGIALAREASLRGAEVKLVLGPTPEAVPDYIEVERVETAGEMLEVVKREIGRAHYFISAAAIADFTAEAREEKMDSRGGEITIRLRPAPKVLEAVRDSGAVKCGFKALHGVSEQELLDAARDLLEESGLDLVVANDVSGGVFGSDENEVYLVDRKGVEHLPRMPKTRVAAAVLDRLQEM